MNSFFVPQLGSQIYTMNGMTTQLNLQADTPRHLSRPVRPVQRRRLFRHAFDVHAVPPAEFAAGSTRTQSRPGARRGGLRRAGQAEHASRPFTYRRVDPGLFDKIVDAEAAARPGPQAARNATAGCAASTEATDASAS
jgi:cytochrome o ubiquinol oxidase subunit 2